jgi:hypothetical protein
MRLSSRRPQRSAVVPARGNRKLRCRLGFNLKIEVQRHRGGIETGPQIGRGGRQAQMNAPRRSNERIAHPTLPFTAASTAAGVASTTWHCAASYRSPLQTHLLLFLQERAAMEVDGVIGILERVAGEHQHHRLAGFHRSLARSFFSPGQRDRRRRLAAQALRRPTPPWQWRSPPRSRPGTSRRSPEWPAPPCATRPDCRCGWPWPACAPPPAPAKLRSFRQAAHQRIGALGLDHRDARHPRHQPQLVQLAEALAQRRTVAQVAAGHNQVVGHIPIEGLGNLEGRRLLPLQPVGLTEFSR